MPQTALGNIGLNYEWDLGSDGWKNGLDHNLILLDTLAQGFVISSSVTAQPGSPAVGDAYILGSTRTGTDWGSDSGSVANAVAVFTNIAGAASPWSYVTPREGWRLYDRQNDIPFFFSGSAWLIEGRRIRSVTGATYTLVRDDAGGSVYINNAAHTLTIPANSAVPVAVGARVLLVNRDGSNAITVNAGGGVTWLGRDLVSTGIPAGELAEIEKTATDEWSVIRAGTVPA